MSGDFGRARSSSTTGGPFGSPGIIGDKRGGRNSSAEGSDSTIEGVSGLGIMNTQSGVQIPAAKQAIDTKTRTVSNGSAKLSDSSVGWKNTVSPQGPSARPTSPTFHHGQHNRNASVESVESQPEHRDFYPWVRATSPRAAISSSQQAGSHTRTPSSGSTSRRQVSINSIDQPKTKHASHLSKQAIVEDDEEESPAHLQGVALESHRGMINNHGETLRMHAFTLNGQKHRLTQQARIGEQQGRAINRLWMQNEATESRIDDAEERHAYRFQGINNHVADQEERNMDADHRQASLDFQLDDVRGTLINHHRDLEDFQKNLHAKEARDIAKLNMYTDHHSNQLAQFAHHFHQQLNQNTQVFGTALSHQAARQNQMQQELQQAQAQLKTQNTMMEQVHERLTMLGLGTTPITPTQAGMNFSNSAYTHQVPAAQYPPQQVFPQQGYMQHAAITPVAGPSNAASNESRSDPRPNIPQPNPNDDVFGPPPHPHYRRAGPSPIAEFEQKPYPELLHSVFVGVEIAVRGVKTKRLDTRSSDPAVQALIKHMGEFNNNLQNTKIYVLRDPRCTIQMLTGYIGKRLMGATIDHTILNHFPSPAFAAEYFEACNAEARALVDMQLANDAGARMRLADNRARIARSIAQLPGFQQWIKDTAVTITNDLVGHLQAAIRDFLHENAYKLLHKPVLEALKIGVRMRQDAKNFVCGWYGSGVRWDYKRMVPRNEELFGHDLAQDPPLHCVLFTMAPNIDQKVSDGKTITTVNLHKAEVVIGLRKDLLR